MKIHIAFWWVILLAVYCKAQFDAQIYYNLYSEYQLAPDDLMQMTPRLVSEKVRDLAGKYPSLQLKEAGRSVEGRPLHHLAFGDGATKLLLWSQMHGDEPTATAALLALFHFFGNQPHDSLVTILRKNLSIHAIIMLNPDGAQRFQRRNMQDIDINRDARLVQSPEAQALKRLKEHLDPQFGFNLHDMRGRETVGKEGKLLNLAFMAPPFNEADEDSPSRSRAKRLVVIMKETLEPFIGGHMARYKADYMPRAFGDAMQNWGISTVLIESGMHDRADPHFIVRMNFIALLRAFDAIATGYIDDADESGYDSIPLEGKELFDLFIRDVLIITGSGIPPFRGDIGINVMRRKNDDTIVKFSQIADLGDLSITTGRQIIDGQNLIVAPGFIGISEDSVITEVAVAAGFTRVIPKKIRQDEGLALDSLQRFRTEWTVRADEVRRYTSIPANALGVQRTGLIKSGYTADLIVFRDSDPQSLESVHIKYVIKDGEIVYGL